MNYLNIDLSMLKIGINNTPVFLFEEYAQKRSLYFHAGHEITEESYAQATDLAHKGAQFQILLDMQEDFLLEYSIEEESLKKLNEDYFFMLDYLADKQALAQSLKIDDFNFKDSFNQAFDRQNFKELISHTRGEIALFDFTVSREQSEKIHHLVHLLKRDSILNREVVLAYHLAKLLNIKDQESLLDLCFAIYLKDIGLTQFKSLKAYKDYYKDPYFDKASPYNLFMLNKFNFELSTLTKRIVLECYELYDGNGHPKGKRDDQIHILSQVCGVCSLLVKYSDSMDLIAKKLINQLSIDDKVYVYHPEIINNLSYIITDRL